MFQEPDFFRDGVDEGHLEVVAGDRQRKPWKSGTGSRIEERTRPRIEDPEDGE